MTRPHFSRFLVSLMVKRMSRFGADQGGSIVVFALCLFMVMCMMGGLAVDLMRHENARTELQNTLDRCVLMAASMHQALDAEPVMRDCVAKAGLTSSIATSGALAIEQTVNSREVAATGVVDTHPFFMHLMGIDKLDALAHAAAEQKITNVEIVLVLDVSGSMSGAKLAGLKVAANEFVASMRANDPDNRVSISIVPYNAQVNLGATLRAKYNAQNLHGVTDVNCLEVPPSAYSSAAMPRTLAIPMMAYADYAYGTNKTNGPVSPTDASYALPRFDRVFCKPTTVNTVRLPQQNVASLQSQINGLEAGGNTSIMLGMKWGLTLLDPSARPMFSELIADGKMPANLEGRPYAYDDLEASKVIVLMTDGEHVSHDRINDAYKTGASGIYLSAGDGNYSVYQASHAGSAKFYVPHLDTWQNTSWTNNGTAAVEQDWAQVWSKLKLSYVAWQFYGRPLGGADASARNTAYNNAFSAIRSTFASVSTMDSQLQQSCDLAKSNKVTVYGIAFEAPANGQAQISQCSTSNYHYFNAADPAGIRTAFRTIASNLTQLKLTQ